MMSYHSRTILPPGASRKRKERETFNSLKPSASASASASISVAKPTSTSAHSNRLLAGYMAHEFLTKGTLFGQKFDPARAEAVPLAGGSAESNRGKGGEAELGLKNEQKKSHYADVASILKTEGAHIPGIINPTQLARWIQM